MTERVFEYSNCTVTVHIPKDNQKRVHKATEKFLKEVINEKIRVNSGV